MSKIITQDVIMKALDYVYEKAVDGIGGLYTAEQMANEYLLGNKSLDKKVNSLIRWQVSKAGTSGFITGLGGILLLPVTIPVSLGSVMYIQIRMIAAIAIMGGYDVKDDRVRTLVYMCLTGNTAKDILKDVGIVIGTKLTTQMIKNISSKTITEINKKVGFRLLTKFGEKGALNLGKAIPLVGGGIGLAFDSTATYSIGKIAKKTFINK